MKLAGFNTPTYGRLYLPPDNVNKKMYREFAEKLFRTLDKNGIFHGEFALKRKDGTVFPTDHTVKEIKDSSGKRILVVSVVRDISAQKQALENLNRHEKDLFNRNKELEELNIALRVLLDQREAERGRLEESFADSINSAIIPYLDKIRKTSLSTVQEQYLGFLETSLREAIRPYAHRISDKLMRLSPSETIVANSIKRGLRSKEIAAQLNVTVKTVEFHRSSIRKKLGLKGRKINLKTYLASLN